MLGNSELYGLGTPCPALSLLIENSRCHTSRAVTQHDRAGGDHQQQGGASGPQRHHLPLQLSSISGRRMALFEGRDLFPGS